MTNGQRAYEAYNAHQGNKAHDGKPLPLWSDVSPENQAAWEAFSGSVRTGSSVADAYSYHYLAFTKGKAVSGAPAPSWMFFVHNRADIVGAWESAYDAAKS